MQSLSATHPSLDKRILRLDPHFDGNFDSSYKIDSPRAEEEADKKEPITREELAKKVATVVTGAAMANIANAIDQIGKPNQETINYDRSLISELPIVIKEAAREPYGARAVIYSLVLDPGREVLARQLNHLRDCADPGGFV